MSATDTRAEFCGMVDDWWCQLFAMRLGSPLPSEKIKFRFITFVEERCAEVGSWRGKITIGMRQLKEDLNSLYWYAAKCHASDKAKQEGLSKRRKKWEEEYC
jgi:hypothetical protein